MAGSEIARSPSLRNGFTISLSGRQRMPAYLFIKTKIHNRDEYMRYVAAVRSVGKKYNSRYLVRSRPVEVLEGDAEEWGDYLLMVSEFPTVEAAREFWHSEEY